MVVVLTPVWCCRFAPSFLVGGAAFPSSFGVVLFLLLALVVRCCFPPFAFWLALLLPFLLGVAFLFLLLLGAGAALEPRRLIYGFVSFVFQCYFHVCGFLFVFHLSFSCSCSFFLHVSALCSFYFHFHFIFSSYFTIINMFMFCSFFFSFSFFLEKEKGVEARATHLPEKSRSRGLPPPRLLLTLKRSASVPWRWGCVFV